MRARFDDRWTSVRRQLGGVGIWLLAAALPAHAAGLLPPPLSARQPSDGPMCEAAIAGVEPGFRLPPHLLTAIGIVESGRLDPRTGRVAPWPWAINIAGTGHIFETKDAAIAAVEAAQAAGVRSIDVGCMQINLMYHPNAFASLDQAFDPHTNALYAATLLTSLFSQTGDWRKTAAYYHSQTPAISDAYAERVMAIWPLAGQYVGAPKVPAQPSGDALDRFAPEMMTELRAHMADHSTERANLVAAGVLPHPAATSRVVAADRMRRRHGDDVILVASMHRSLVSR